MWGGRLHELGVDIIPYRRLFGEDADSAYFQHTLSQEAVIMDGVDTVVTALGHDPETALADELSGHIKDLHLIGDCLSPRSVEEAVLEGLQIAAQI